MQQARVRPPARAASLWRVILLSLVCLVLLGLIGDITNDPADVVEKYLSLDKKGARLEAASFEVLKPYIAWSEEPAWGQVVVTAGHTVSRDIREWEVIDSLEARIPATFQVLGAMHWESATFLAEPQEETIWFHVRAIENRWRIVDPMVRPHVGKKRLLDFVRSALLLEKDDDRRERLRQLKMALEEAQE